MDRITSSDGTPIACHRLADGLPLIVADAARAELVQQGVEVGEVQDLGGVLYASFSDPDLAYPVRAYHGTNLERLAHVNRRYDPDCFFHFPQSVPDRVLGSGAPAGSPVPKSYS